MFQLSNPLYFGWLSLTIRFRNTCQLFFPGTLFPLRRNLLIYKCTVMSLELQMCQVQPSSDVKVLLISYHCAGKCSNSSNVILHISSILISGFLLGADSAPCFYEATECFRHGWVTQHYLTFLSMGGLKRKLTNSFNLIWRFTWLDDN